jgi:type IV pilus biogenesis protein CpaD/CtpE
MIIALAALSACNNVGPDLEQASDRHVDCASTAAATDMNWRPGCATRRNLAALAETPSDLTRPRQEAPRDAVRRDAVINSYAQSRAAAQAQGGNANFSASGTQAQP